MIVQFLHQEIYKLHYQGFTAVLKYDINVVCLWLKTKHVNNTQ